MLFGFSNYQTTLDPEETSSLPVSMSSTSTTSTSLAPSELPTYLYKIIPISSSPLPSPLPEVLPLSDLDAKDGFIHLSTSLQVVSTADRYFNSPSETSIYIAKIPYERVKEDIRWERAGRGVFAHLYNGGRLGTEEIEEVRLRVKKEGGTWSELFEEGEGKKWLIY